MTIIKTPANQQRHTNIAVVKSKTKPKFELACYKNKVIDFRNGIEKDISKVLQIDQIFIKVSEGTVAKAHDLEKVFGTNDKNQIISSILKTGELQISEKERLLMFETAKKDIINFVVNQCLNPETSKPYTAGLIEREMKNINFTVDLNKSSKVQALNVIRKLSKVIPIVRARMRLKVVVDKNSVSSFNEFASSLEESEECTVEKSIDDSNNTMFFILIDPGLFRKIDEKISQSLGGTIEVVDSCVQDIRDKSIEEYTVNLQNTHNQNNDHNEENEENEEKESIKRKKKQKKSNTIKETKFEEESTLETSTLPPKSKKKGKKGSATVDDLYDW